MTRTAERVSLLIAFCVAAAAPVIVYDRLLARRSSARALGDAEIVTRYHEFYYDYSERRQTVPRFWLGIPASQNPNDVWMIQEILSEVRPDYVLETGTYRGGSALIWAMVLEQVNPAGRVITVDVKDFLNGQKLPPIASRIDFMVADSLAPEFVAEVARKVRGKKVVVVLDSDHSKKHVLGELRAFAPLVSQGSYIVVQDTNVNGHPVWPEFGPGPMEAVEEFLAGNQQFVSDRSRERLLLSYHPKGYLKRVGSPR